jgi:predicted nucleic acid-binding protein
MPKVVSDTTPLISLLKLNRLELLQNIYSQIYIPTTVYKESEAGRAKEYYKDLSKIDWINIVEIKNKQAVKYFLDLYAGEAEAIVLATELNADLIILDENLAVFTQNMLI